MTNKELVNKLMQLDPDAEIVIHTICANDRCEHEMDDTLTEDGVSTFNSPNGKTYIYLEG